MHFSHFSGWKDDSDPEVECLQRVDGGGQARARYPRAMEDTQYIIKPRPPVRGFFLAAVLCVVGAGVIVATAVLDWSVIIGTLGGMLLLLGLLLFIVGLLAMRARRSVLLFTEDGYELDSPQGRRKGRWDNVHRITQAGLRMTIIARNGKKTYLVFAPCAEAQFDEMRRDMVKRLDAARGYTAWV